MLAQTLVWFQTYGQFRWDFLARNNWILIICAMPITYVWLEGTKIGMEVFNNQSWPLRFLGFSTGILVFTICSRFVLNEPMTLKSVVSVILCLLIVILQIFWKD